MGNWSGQRGKNNHQEMQGTGSQKGKPPLANWKTTVPAWEKSFCTSVGSIPWWKILEAKRSMYLYDNVVQWNDSAGEEAFKNAKARFYAKINGLPCNILLPDPDTYIDEVDWDTKINPELILDLERKTDDCKGIAKDENVVILDSSLLLSHLAGIEWGTGWGTGWGDAEDNNNQEKKSEHCDWNTGKQENTWEANYSGRKEGVQDNRWSNDNSWGGNTWEGQYYESWDSSNRNNIHHCRSKNFEHRNGRDWGRSNWNRKKREGFDGYASGYKFSRLRSCSEV